MRASSAASASASSASSTVSSAASSAASASAAVAASSTAVPSSSGLAILRPALVLFALLSLITGLAYPALVTVVAHAVFPAQAAGSLVVKDGKLIGSTLIGQSFSDPGHFWGRPSATSPMPFNPGASSGSNQGPLNPALTEAMKSRIEALKAADPGNTRPIPVDLVTASASGLDPEISVAAATYQIERIARTRNLKAAQVQALVDQQTRQPIGGWLGEARVNVLALNLALDAIPR